MNFTFDKHKTALLIMDYRLAVLQDACADLDPAVHAMLMDKVYPRQAEVMDVDAFVAAMARP